jgi:hypothetical protein
MTLSPSDLARLDLAVKQDDSPYTTFAVSPATPVALESEGGDPADR